MWLTIYCHPFRHGTSFIRPSITYVCVATDTPVRRKPRRKNEPRGRQTVAQSRLYLEKITSRNPDDAKRVFSYPVIQLTLITICSYIRKKKRIIDSVRQNPSVLVSNESILGYQNSGYPVMSQKTAQVRGTSMYKLAVDELSSTAF